MEYNAVSLKFNLPYLRFKSVNACNGKEKKKLGSSVLGDSITITAFRKKSVSIQYDDYFSEYDNLTVLSLKTRVPKISLQVFESHF